ncbi:hypothetical protein COY25_03235 [Candidatus Uhrbacteria bacterium CG_4_10_14_0_2_um_filter_41_7]|uniref:Uncharacterized protein n=1 Tax=Candidatus Uhrbacteria bacterium CG_4_9_14_3_um_filter_41_35 TaxID=1975034 RepID=A0A2M7XGU0_9BACT|nr:MAG: hypothetical protein COV92_00595 [Candidatus Uhrbacteria bacterium CG11_big_fil_rev_8_21_14_0_20_41_9]PIZ53606.1 MAG: hypothetical protein COY25_03235 [Candidatus Uhrbacteria bacterium CG_4_10_14_0_2_um_filter_41_7]PJA47069.1 MAG: hypothetical protein CO173_00190 [Candidatus Uhrbacteria bacterium CG_4_9_14_3_um_filter_41_35]
MTNIPLQDFIISSNLSDTDKVLWARAFTILNEAQVQVLSDVIENDYSKLSFMTENFKEKHEAFQNRDANAMQATFDKETSFVESQLTA